MGLRDYHRIEKVRTSKRVRYNTSLLANEHYRAKFRDAVSEALPEINTNASASEIWSSVENIVKEAAESTIGLTASTGRRDTPHCPRNGCNVRRTKKTKTMSTEQFTDPTVDGLDAFTGEPSQVTRPITPEDVTLAIGKLNTGRTSGHDDIPAVSSAELLSHTIANIFNDALQHHELLDIGKGVLILVQKPGKPTGPLTSLRPIVLLSVLRKTLSLIVLSIIAPKVDEYLSSSQS